MAMTRSGDSADDARRFRHALFVLLAFVALLWLLQVGAALFDLSLVGYGIFPRRIIGIAGIALAPLIHGSFSHLIANTLPLIVLGMALLYGYPRSARLVLGCLYLGTGIGVWLSARDAYHVGASGLSTGMMFFVFIIGAIRWDPRAMALSMLAFFLYGSMVWGIFPIDPHVSYETHFFGALIGVVLAIVLRNRDPALPKKRYSWEDEEPMPGDDTANGEAFDARAARADDTHDEVSDDESRRLH